MISIYNSGFSLFILMEKSPDDLTIFIFVHRSIAIANPGYE